MFIPWGSGVEAAGGVLNKELLRRPTGLLNFIDSPQASILAAALLEQGRPSTTHIPSFGQGLSKGLEGIAAYDKYEQEQQLKGYKAMQDKLLEQAKLDILRGQLDLDREKLYSPKAQSLVGLPREYADLERVKEIYGEDSYVYQEAKRALESRLAAQSSMIDYREKMNESADKRFSTSLGKHALELEDIKAGFVPGTNRQVQIQTREEQKKLLGQWELKVQRDVTDPKTRERVLFAKNIDKTIKNINIDDLVQFSGLAGAGAKTFEELKSSLGYPSDAYKRYAQAKVGVDLLAKQMRQFYGDSISPTVADGLKIITNPSSWKNSPEVAKLAYEQLVSILQQEEETFRDSLQELDVYSKEGNENLFLGKYTMDAIKATAKRKGLSIEAVKKLLMDKEKNG